MTPFEDPTYQPEHPPLANGDVPLVVGQWGPRSQLRWFARHHREIGARPAMFWARWYCQSPEHKGLCCSSCMEDGDFDPEYGCCCYALKEESA